MDYLKDNHYRVIALKDVEAFLPENLPADPKLDMRYNNEGDIPLEWPAEVLASRANIDFWLSTMAVDHQYSDEEIAEVMGWELAMVDEELESLNEEESTPAAKDVLKILPFPGGRHPRIGFREGMLSPMRGTKLSVFLPWDENDFLILDLPEAVSTQFGLTFLGHKHIPTLFDYMKVPIENSDWTRDDEGNWSNLWKLPMNIEIGAKAIPQKDRVLMELWLNNHTKDTLLTGLSTQVCVMLGQTKSYAQQTNDNKLFACPFASVESDDGQPSILTAWEGCHHPWGNADCPCLHADPTFPDCPPGETVKLRGILWFYQGNDVQSEFEQIKKDFSWL